jgi:hypothetical protein
VIKKKKFRKSLFHIISLVLFVCSDAQAIKPLKIEKTLLTINHFLTLNRIDKPFWREAVF